MTRLFELDFQLLHDTVLLAISVFFLCVALLLTAALQGAVGLQLPLVVLEFWFVLC